MAQVPSAQLIQQRRHKIYGLILALLLSVAGLAFIAPVLFVSVNWPPFVVSFLRPMAFLGAALLLPAAALLAAGLMDSVRRWHPQQTANKLSVPQRMRKPLAWLTWLQSWLGTASRGVIDSGHIIIGLLVPALSIFALSKGWQAGAMPSVAEPKDLQIFGGALLIGAFPLLLLERLYASGAVAIAEAPQINRLLRVPLLALLALALEAFAFSAGLGWASVLGLVAASITALAAAEIIVRCVVSIFLPTPPRAERKAIVDSGFAAILRLGIPRIRTFGAAVKSQFGIDLSRSWALSFVQRALVPLLGGIVLFVWLLTGMSAVGVSERAVYERLGVPVRVLHSGLHVHFPWPIGIVRRVEYGIVREVPLIAAGDPGSEPGAMAEEVSAPVPPPADGPAPSQDDRLWTSLHPSEGTYLIASVQGSQQGFQAVSSDMAVVYRFGLSDEAAKQAVYSTAEPQVLIRAIASRLLSQHFARYTLQDVLGQNREVLAETFRRDLQAELDELGTGVETIAVIFEAVHPPSGAAAAYHDVQASQIRSQAKVADAQGSAIRTLKGAQRQAIEVEDFAKGTAEELLRQAETERTLFVTERTAFERSAATFRLERWFEKLTTNLKDSELLIIDHRLSRQSSPTIDLRPLSQTSTYSYTPPVASDEDH